MDVGSSMWDSVDDYDVNDDDFNDEGDKEPVVDEEEEFDPRTLLTREQIRNYKAVFDNFDVQKSGKIPAKTIGFVIRLMGFNPSKAEIKNFLKEIDPRNTGWIDFVSFLTPIARKINDEPESYEMIISAFRVFDESNTNTVQTATLTEFLTTLGEDLEDFEIETLLKAADPKGTGQIPYVDFVEKMMGIVRKSAKDKKKDKKKKKK